jgi:DNA-binding PadR family transcriptional regulator
MARQAILSPQQAVLGLLMRGPMHGYELYQKYATELGQMWHAGRSQVYSILKQLDEAGQVVAQTELQESRPARKVYHLTATGQQAFLNWVHQPVQDIRDIRVLFLAKLYFLHQLGLAGMDELVEAQKAVCRERMDSLARAAAELSADDFGNLVFEFRRHQLEAILDWLDHCRRQFVVQGD